jgi:hypothetical protein
MALSHFYLEKKLQFKDLIAFWRLNANNFHIDEQFSQFLKGSKS